MPTSRERLQTTLGHRQPDRVCVDIGSNFNTGGHASIVSALRQELLGDPGYRVKVMQLIQMNGEFDEELRRELPTDVVGVMGETTALGVRNADWKPWELPDRTPVLVPGAFHPTIDEDGDILMYPRGDTTLTPSVRMPRDGLYFDCIVRQEPIDEDRLNPADNCEEFAILGPQAVSTFALAAERLANGTDYGVMGVPPGVGGWGDQYYAPAALARPRGIRDPEEWYVSLLTRPNYVHAVFQRQTEIALENIRLLAAAVGDHIQIVRVCGTELGGQDGLLFSPRTYRELFSPYYRRINAAIHAQTNWKTYKHSCGSVSELIPDLIEDGFDILNPVQTSAANMDPRTLKREFGAHLVFWGGGVDTQRTLPFGTPDEVYRQVRERIDIFNDGGGYVFATIHNIQPHVPVPNLVAMLKAIRDSWVVEDRS